MYLHLLSSSSPPHRWRALCYSVPLLVTRRCISVPKSEIILLSVAKIVFMGGQGILTPCPLAAEI